MNLSDLARFTITKIQQQDPSQGGFAYFAVAGNVSDIGQIESGSRYWLYIAGGNTSLIVDVTSIDHQLSTAVIEGHTSDADPAIRIGDSYPILTAYWNAYIYAAILDEQRVWTRTPFKAIGSFESTVPGYAVRTSPARPGLSRYSPSPATGTEDAVRVVHSGWDHEHCEICNRHIDADNPIAYVDDGGTWLSDKCHEAFAVGHDLQFIPEYPTWGR